MADRFERASQLLGNARLRSGLSHPEIATQHGWKFQEAGALLWSLVDVGRLRAVPQPPGSPTAHRFYPPL